MDEIKPTKKDEILELLKRDGEAVFSKICSEIRLNKYYAERYLDELEAEKKIEKDVHGTYTYYRLRGAKKK